MIKLIIETRESIEGNVRVSDQTFKSKDTALERFIARRIQENFCNFSNELKKDLHEKGIIQYDFNENRS